MAGGVLDSNTKKADVVNPNPETWKVGFGVIEEPLLVSGHLEKAVVVVLVRRRRCWRRRSRTLILYCSALTLPLIPSYAELPVVGSTGGKIGR